MQHDLLRELDEFITAASRKGGKRRGEIAEILLRAITVELLPRLKAIAELQPALNRVAEIADALSEGKPTKYDPLRGPAATKLVKAMQEHPRALAKTAGWSQPKAMRAKRQSLRLVRAAPPAMPGPPKPEPLKIVASKPPATVLEYLQQNPGVKITSQRDLARLVGTSQSSVSRQLRRLEGRGKVKRLRKPHGRHEIALL